MLCFGRPKKKKTGRKAPSTPPSVNKDRSGKRQSIFGSRRRGSKSSPHGEDHLTDEDSAGCMVRSLSESTCLTLQRRQQTQDTLWLQQKDANTKQLPPSTLQKAQPQSGQHLYQSRRQSRPLLGRQTGGEENPNISTTLSNNIPDVLLRPESVQRQSHRLSTGLQDHWDRQQRLSTPLFSSQQQQISSRPVPIVLSHPYNSQLPPHIRPSSTVPGRSTSFRMSLRDHRPRAAGAIFSGDHGGYTTATGNPSNNGSNHHDIGGGGFNRQGPHLLPRPPSAPLLSGGGGTGLPFHLAPPASTVQHKNRNSGGSSDLATPNSPQRSPIGYTRSRDILRQSADDASSTELSVSELRDIAERQTDQIANQERLLRGREERLASLKVQENRQRRMLQSNGHLRELKETMDNQETRLKQLRGLRAQVEHSKKNNGNINEELEVMQSLFATKRKELSVCMQRVETLTKELNEIREKRQAQNQRSNTPNQQDVNSGSSNNEADRLERRIAELQRMLDRRPIQMSTVDGRPRTRDTSPQQNNITPSRTAISNRTTPVPSNGEPVSAFIQRQSRDLAFGVTTTTSADRYHLLSGRDVVARGNTTQPNHSHSSQGVIRRDGELSMECSSSSPNSSSSSLTPEQIYPAANIDHHHRPLTAASSPPITRKHSFGANKTPPRYASRSVINSTYMKKMGTDTLERYVLEANTFGYRRTANEIYQNQLPRMVVNNARDNTPPRSTNHINAENSIQVRPSSVIPTSNNSNSTVPIGNQGRPSSVIPSTNTAHSNSISSVQGRPSSVNPIVTKTPYSNSTSSVAMRNHGRQSSLIPSTNIPQSNTTSAVSISNQRRPSSVNALNNKQNYISNQNFAKTSTQEKLTDNVSRPTPLTNQNRSPNFLLHNNGNFNKNTSPLIDQGQTSNVSAPTTNSVTNSNSISLNNQSQSSSTSSTTNKQVYTSSQAKLKITDVTSPTSIHLSSKSMSLDNEGRPASVTPTSNTAVYKSITLGNHGRSMSLITDTSDKSTTDSMNTTDNNQLDDGDSPRTTSVTMETCGSDDLETTTKSSSPSIDSGVAVEKGEISSLSASRLLPRSCIKKQTARRTRNSVTFHPLALLLDASLEGDLELVKKAAKMLPNISATNDEGITALHNAICAEHGTIAEFLVRSGADVNAGDTDGWTPLHCAASCGLLDLAKLLVEAGASLFARTLSDRETPLDKCDSDLAEDDQVKDYLTEEQKKLGEANDGRVFTLFPYSAENEDELSLGVNQEVEVVDLNPEGEVEWVLGKLVNDKSTPAGLIAMNYISLYQLIMPSQQPEKKETSLASSQDDEGELSDGFMKTAM